MVGSGWDTSCQFQFAAPNFNDTINPKWAVNTPLNLGLYPALSRMIYRNDVKESDTISSRNVCIKKILETGKMNFEEKMYQVHDEKAIGGKEVPNAALAVGKVVVDYTETDTATKTLDISKYMDGDVIRSVTGQLAWKSGTGMDGYFTVNTDGTKAVVGFAPNKNFKLGNVSITLKNRFGSVFITSLEKNKDLKDAKRILVQAIGRGYNSGMEYNLSHTAVKKLGTAPVIMEPIIAELDLGGITKKAKVNILDYDGRQTGQTLPCVNGDISIDGTKTKAIYYEIVKE